MKALYVGMLSLILAGSANAHVGFYNHEELFPHNEAYYDCVDKHFDYIDWEDLHLWADGVESNNRKAVAVPGIIDYCHIDEDVRRD